MHPDQTKLSSKANKVLVCLAALFLAIGISLTLGGSDLSLFDPQWGRVILFEIRGPRILLALICGAALAVAGTLTQGLFRNPLASPGILGTSTGASLFAALALNFLVSAQHIFLTPLFAFFGATLATIIVVFVARRLRYWHTVGLLLLGFALSAIWGGLTSLVLSFALSDQHKTGAIIQWLMGGFSAKGSDHVLWVSIPTVIGVGLSFAISKKLDILALGETTAQSLGIDLDRLKNFTIFCVALLVGPAVSVGGPLPFVGLMIPHLSRLIIGPQHTWLMGLSVINGMTLLVLADCLARTLRAPQEMEVGILLSLIGAPFFLFLLMSQREAKGG
jgi:iron complex transport system permease protein